jgi:hypothetical protein
MEISEAQYRQIEHCLPKQRGNVSMANLDLLNAILYVPSTAASGEGCPSDLAIGTPSTRA